MTGFRDTCQGGAHVAHLDTEMSVEHVAFGDDGVIWNPTPAQHHALTMSEMRRSRFVQIERESAPEPTPVAVEEQVAEAPAPVAVEESLAEMTPRRRRRFFQEEATQTVTEGAKPTDPEGES